MKNTLIIMVFILGLVFAGCSNKQKEQALSENKNQSQVNTTNSVAPNNFENLNNSVAQGVNNQKAEITRHMKNKSSRMRKAELAKYENGRTLNAAGTAESENSEAVLEAELKDGRAILIYDESETVPLETQGDKVLAVNMPDGKLYPAELDNGKTIVTIPGHGKIQSKMINGKMYLFDKDNNMYAVKVTNNKLVAVLNSGKSNSYVKK